MKYGIGISLGGSSLRAGLFGADGKLAARGSADLSETVGYAQTLDKLVSLAESLVARTGKRAETLGLCLPAAVDGAAGTVLRADDERGLVGEPLGRDLSRRLGVSVRLAGSADAAALAEARFGAGKNYDSLVYLSLGETAGCGIVCGGEIFEGFGGAVAAEHMTFEVGGVPCPCGRRGCLGQYISGAALRRDAKRAMFEHKNSALWRYAGDPEGATAKTVFDAARGGDAAAQKVVKSYLLYLGEGILNLVNLLHPQAIVLGGEIAGEGEYLLEPLRKYVGERLYIGCDAAPLSIVRAAMGEDAFILGAFALAL